MFTVIIIGIELLVGFLLQTTVFSHLEIAGVVPNLLIIITVAVGYQKGNLQGMATGLVGGMLLDISFGEILGYYALVLLLIGYCAGFMNRYYIENDLFLPLGMIASAQLVYSFAEYVFRFLVRGRLNVLYYLGRIMLPNILYTVVVAIVLYKLLDYIFIRVLSEKNADGDLQ